MSKRGTPKPPTAGQAERGSRDRAGAQAVFPVHEHIGRQLKAMFDEVVTQPVPDKLRKLLEELERKQSKSLTVDAGNPPAEPIRRARC